MHHRIVYVEGRSHAASVQALDNDINQTFPRHLKRGAVSKMQGYRSALEDSGMFDQDSLVVQNLVKNRFHPLGLVTGIDHLANEQVTEEFVPHTLSVFPHKGS